MVDMKNITLPLNNDIITKLNVGNEVSLTGAIYTARDQAHRRLTQAIKSYKRPPFDLKGRIVYYCGPTQTPKGSVIGSCGPTTSSRMDEFTPVLLAAGLKGTIGKGRRSKEVISAIKKYKGVYFITYAGCGALLAGYVKSKRLIAYPDLGPEAIYELRVRDFPAIVAVDSKGRSIYGSF